MVLWYLARGRWSSVPRPKTVHAGVHVRRSHAKASRGRTTVTGVRRRARGRCSGSVARWGERGELSAVAGRWPRRCAGVHARALCARASSFGTIAWPGPHARARVVWAGLAAWAAIGAVIFGVRACQGAKWVAAGMGMVAVGGRSMEAFESCSHLFYRPLAEKSTESAASRFVSVKRASLRLSWYGPNR